MDSNQEPAGYLRYYADVLPMRGRGLSPEHIRREIATRPVVRLGERRGQVSA